MRPEHSEDAVVVPADHGGSSLACIRSLGRRGVRVVGVAADRDAAALRSKHCAEGHVVPSPSTDLPGYRDALLDLAARPGVRTVVPLYEPDAYVLSKHREAFAEHVATPWPGFGTVRTAQDRHHLLGMAARAGVPTPDTELLEEWPDWHRQCVVKPRFALQVEEGEASYGDVHFPEPGDPPKFDDLVREMGHVPVVQEYVPGDAECGYFAVFEDGEPVAEFQHRRVRSYTYAGGASVYRKAIDDPNLRDVGRRTLSALDWEGPAMVECKRDPRDGQYKLVEVNPRFWGSLPLGVAAGVDFPAVYDALAGGAPAPDTDYKTGVGCHTLRGEVSYLHSLLRYDYEHTERPSLAGSLGRVAASLVGERNFDYLSASDPRPFVQDFLAASGLAERYSLPAPGPVVDHGAGEAVESGAGRRPGEEEQATLDGS